MKIHATNYAFLLSLCAFLTGCVSYGEWSRSPSQYTWCAPGKRFVQETRRMYSSYAEGADHRYIGCDGKEYRGDEPWATIERSLAESAIATSWTRGYDGRVNNPLDLYLVSFSPNIVIACTPAGRAREFPSLDSKVFNRPLIIGTQLSCQNPEHWTTVPGGVSNSLKALNETERRLEFQGTVVTLKREGNKWVAVREAR